MIYKIRAVDILGREVIHPVDVGDRRMGILGSIKAPHWIDLRGVDLTNAWLRGADLQGANLEGAILLGADLREANLQNANLCNANLTYSNLRGANLRGANCEGTALYPCGTIGAHFYGAKFAPDSDVAEYVRIDLEERCRRMRITPTSVAYRKLRLINGPICGFGSSGTSSEIVSPPIESKRKFLCQTRLRLQCRPSLCGEQP